MEENFVKIVNATYKLLDFFPDSDPLKNKAKEKALAVLEGLTLISSAEGWASLRKEKATAQLLDDIEILETYLKLGKYQGWIDNINFLIITKEYSSIRDRIYLPKGPIRNNLEVISSVLDNKKELGSQSSHLGVEVKDKIPEDYSDRQRKILLMLSEKEKVQVSDIIKEIPNITKRTIRRDLDYLLKKGEIIRIGEFNQVFYQKSNRTYALS